MNGSGYFFIFVLGAIVGSFLNVVIYRFNTGESINGRSKCPHCNRKLKWYELIPVLSFIVQRGRCRGCEARISRQYPLVELVTGLIFLLITWKLGLQVEVGFFTGYSTTVFGQFWLVTGYFLVIFSILIVISVYDLYHKIIPNGLVYSFIALSFLSPFIVNSEKILDHFLSGIVLFFFFASMWFISKGRWMGFGDAKLALGIGLFLGSLKSLVAILLSFWTGAFVGVALLLSKKFGLKSQIPFGPFLVLGMLISFLYGEYIFSLFF